MRPAGNGRLRTVLAVAVVVLALSAVAAEAVDAAVASPRTALVAPLPSNAAVADSQDAQVSAPACPSASFCVALATYFDTSRQFQGAIETYSHGEWSSIEAPVPTGSTQFDLLDDVACPTVGWCVAVGGSQGLIETLSKGTWTPMNAPMPTGIAGARVDAVACPAKGECWALGGDSTASGAGGFIDTLSDGTWSAMALPPPAGTSNVNDLLVSAVRCPDVSNCVAVGNFSDSAGEEGLIATLSNGAWTTSEAPLPAGATSAELTAVSCARAGSCVAVGATAVPDEEQALIETLSSSTWTPLQAPLPSDAGTGESYLDDVTCPSAGSCVAVGLYSTVIIDGVTMPALIDTFAGGRWTGIAAPTPPSSQPWAGLAGATCGASGSCSAVGWYEVQNIDRGVTTEGLIDQEVSGIWTATEAPFPVGAGQFASDNLVAIACGPAAFCLAVGDVRNLSAEEDGFQGLVVAPERLSVSPKVASPSTVVTATVTGDFASDGVTLRWGSKTGTVLTSGATDSSGELVLAFEVPPVAAGTYHVFAVGSAGASVRATLAVN